MEFLLIFRELKKILQPYEEYLDCKSDLSGDYYLDTKHLMKNNKQLFFGSVKINKNYVSYHLMPIYVNPDLLKNITENLKRRMQGKSCFNFKSIDKELLKELSSLTKAGYQYYKHEGLV